MVEPTCMVSIGQQKMKNKENAVDVQNATPLYLENNEILQQTDGRGEQKLQMISLWYGSWNIWYNKGIEK